MARSFLRENQLGDPDVLSEAEHALLVHENLVVSGTLTVSGTIQCDDVLVSDDKKITFGTDLDSSVWYDSISDALMVNTPLSGVNPVEDEHLATKKYIDDELATVSGGGLSLLTLSDTPSIYEEGEYLRSTTSGVEWTIPDTGGAVSGKFKEENVSPVYKGQACTVVGSSGSKLEVGLCDCDNIDRFRIIGLAETDTLQNEEGIVIHKGFIRGVDTRATNTHVNPNGETWQPSDLLWVSSTPGGLTKFRPTSGRSVKAARTTKGSDSNDTLVVLSHVNSIWATSATGEDVVLRVGDSAGANKVSIRNYDNDEVAGFDSYGNLTTSGLLDGVDLDLFKSEFDSHLHDERYYTKSEVTTISGDLQTSINSVPNTWVSLSDTPNSYTGIEGNYIRTTASGITTVSGIILEAVDGSEWLLSVTTSGVLYTTAV